MASLPPPSNLSFWPLQSVKFRKSFGCRANRSLKLLETARKSTTPYTSYFHQISYLCREGLLEEAFSVLNQMETANFQTGPDIYGELLQCCVYQRAVVQALQIHAQVLKRGPFFYKNVFVETKLVIFYAKCGISKVASDLFLRLTKQSVFSWAAIIGLHCREGSNEKALLCFCEMLERGFLPDNFILPNALKACSALNFVGFGKAVHGYVVKLGFTSCVFVATSLLDVYGKCGIMEDARRVFDEIPDRSLVSWNSMIVCFVQNGMNEDGMDIFYHMRVEGVQPTRVTISSFLSACANLGSLDEGRQAHAIAVVGGLELDNILGASLINFYSKIGMMEDAELVFRMMFDRDIVTFNLIISGYVQHGQLDKAFYMCQRMISEKLRYDSVTLSSILSACTYTGCLELGKCGHGYSFRHNIEPDVVVASSLIDMYAKFRKIDDARCVFDFSSQKDQVVWNTIIATYAQAGLSGEALKLFYEMQLEGVPPNVISWNSVIFGFFRNRRPTAAKDLFREMQSAGVKPNLYTWTTLISGLAQNGCAYEAIQYFREMQEAGFSPNNASIISVLLACLELGFISIGKATHGYITRHELSGCLCVVSSLAKIYAECGKAKSAEKIAESMPLEVELYNTVISACTVHGGGKERPKELAKWSVPG
ncbi:pentatricopeptide repeat-containing protein At5g55740, chloroplastic [Aristolochia californica]|uniref:pentatricopeptide repeat-containing protein At5g55740, chloroplastic n=1 Tax=Aristolochia californica TaxID=171875 RepID=UPI0035E2B5E1